jgi:hypothetical protein
MARIGTCCFSTAVTLWFGAGALVALSPQAAEACSPGLCRPGYFLPRDGASIPANTPALAWKKSEITGDAGVQELHLIRLDGDASDVPAWTLEEQADGLVWIKLETELQVGGRYRLDAEGDCSHRVVEFEVTEAAELPETLGGVDVAPVAAGQVQVGTASGSCSIGVQAVHAELSPRFDTAASPWAGLLAYETKVDGEPYHPLIDILPRATPDFASIVYAECPDRYPPGEKRDDGAFDEDLSEGEHVITLEAQIPGVGGTLASSPARVMLDCGAWDTLADDSAGSATGSSSSCSLRWPSSGAGQLTAWLLVVALFWFARRRRDSPAPPRYRDASGRAAQTTGPSTGGC